MTDAATTKEKLSWQKRGILAGIRVTAEEGVEIMEGKKKPLGVPTFSPGKDAFIHWAQSTNYRDSDLLAC